jgi:hypothetical protein
VWRRASDNQALWINGMVTQTYHVRGCLTLVSLTTVQGLYNSLYKNNNLTTLLLVDCRKRKLHTTRG